MRELLTMSYSSGALDIPLSGETIPQVLDRVASQFPNRDAVISRHQQIRRTYTEFRADVNQVAKGLHALGLRKGERAGIWSANNYEWLLVQFATARLGVILVNINPAYRTSELEYALKKSGVRTLIMAPGFRNANYVAMLQQICPELNGHSRGEWRSERMPDLREVVMLGPTPVHGTYTWPELLAMGDDISDETLAEIGRDLQFDDPINIQYTSGTTGFPKGVTLSHHSIVNDGKFVGWAQQITEQDRICITVPFYHCFGMVLSNMVAVYYGAAMVLPNDAFDPLTALEAVHQERCTALYGVPTMFLMELEHPDFDQFDLSSLRTGIMAGAPCPIEMVRRVMTKMNMQEFTIAYGQTETSGVITQTIWKDPPVVRATTVGRPAPHAEIKIADPATGKLVPVGQQGEICVRGYHVMLGYWGDPGATAETIDATRWLHTGDLGTMDQEGYIKVTGRIKDMVIRGGENIYPREVEEFLYTHEQISDVQCFGVPDRKYGEVLAAWVKLRPGAQLTAEAIRAYCHNQIARFKIPHYIKFVDAFPMTVTGKIQKFKMCEAMIAEFGLHDLAASEHA